MNKNSILGLLFAGALSATAIGCAADAQPTTGSSHAADVVVESSAGQSSGVAYYVFHADGTGAAFGGDGTEVARFTSSFDHGAGTLHVESNGESIDLSYSLVTKASQTFVSGRIANEPFSFQIEDGKIVGQETPAPSRSGHLFALLQATSADLEIYGRAHSAWGCAVAGGLLGFGAATLNPFLVSMGVSIAGECFN